MCVWWLVGMLLAALMTEHRVLVLLVWEVVGVVVCGGW